jgi:hypothetical protein
MRHFTLREAHCDIGKRFLAGNLVRLSKNCEVFCLTSSGVGQKTRCLERSAKLSRSRTGGCRKQQTGTIRFSDAHVGSRGPQQAGREYQPHRERECRSQEEFVHPPVRVPRHRARPSKEARGYNRREPRARVSEGLIAHWSRGQQIGPQSSGTSTRPDNRL